MLKLVVNNKYLTFDCDKKVMDYLCKHFKVSDDLVRIISKNKISDKLESLWSENVDAFEGDDGACEYRVRVR
jgi:hypothetical protein